MKKITPAPLQNLKEKWKFFKNIDKTEFDLNNWIEWGEHFLYLVCTLFKVLKVHSLNVPYFQVHYSNIETSLTKQFISNTMFIAQVLPRLPPEKIKSEWNCATFCATFVALVAHLSNVLHFVAHGNGKLTLFYC